MSMLRQALQKQKPYRQRVAVVVMHDSKVLVTHHEAYAPYKGHVYDLPGGGIEDGQTPEDAVIAECAEEVGVKVRNIRPLNSLVHRALFPELKPGEGTPVQIERRKFFAGVESIAYVADYDGKVNHGRGFAEDAMEWEWMSVHDAQQLMFKQSKDRKEPEDGVYAHMGHAIMTAGKL